MATRIVYVGYDIYSAWMWTSDGDHESPAS